jgi:nucleotide-binding universal stress UspA family protein
MKKILVPTDFSGLSRNAEEYAASFAKAFDAEVSLLHVYREHLPATVGPEPWKVTTSDLHLEKEKFINREIEYLKETYSIEVRADVQTGSQSSAIARTAGETQADLIVMALRGGTGSEITGRIVLNTIRKTKIPVLIIPDGLKFVPIKNIALAIDFNEMIDNACVDPLFELYKKFNSSLRVLHVDEKAAELKASEVPEKLHMGVVLSRFSYEYERIESYEIEEGIQNFIDKHPTDLLVLIAHHHTLYERLFERMHTKYLTSRIKLPLLILSHQQT